MCSDEIDANIIKAKGKVFDRGLTPALQQGQTSQCVSALFEVKDGAGSCLGAEAAYNRTKPLVLTLRVLDRAYTVHSAFFTCSIIVR